MDLGFSEEQEMLRTTARDFLTNECPAELVKQLAEDEKGYSPEMWKKMAELGWMGLTFPEEYDGMGMSSSRRRGEPVSPAPTSPRWFSLAIPLWRGRVRSRKRSS